jgi:hypothetical protein
LEKPRVAEAILGLVYNYNINQGFIKLSKGYGASRIFSLASFEWCLPSGKTITRKRKEVIKIIYSLNFFYRAEDKYLLKDNLIFYQNIH